MKIKQTLIIFALVLGFGSFLISPMVSAADCVDSKGNKIFSTSIIPCGGTGTTVESTGAWSLLLLAINILTAGIGVVAVGGIVYGSILYAASSGNAEQTKKAIGIITNVVIGLIAYALMFSFLNFIIPGGLF